MRKAFLTLFCALLLTGCSNTEDMVNMTGATNQPMATKTTQPTSEPTATNVIPFTDGGGSMMDTPDMPDVSDMPGMPGATDMPESTGVATKDKAKRVVEQIEDELERLSEVDDAEVIIAGNSAAVALEFDDQYRGGIDDRLRGVVEDRIASVISGVTNIAITADETIMDAIESLGDRIDTVSDMTQLRQDVEAIIRKIEGQNA